MIDNTWQRALVALAYAVIGTLVIFGLYWAQKVLVPIALAIFLAFILVRPVRGLQRTRLPRVPAVIIVVVAVTALVVGGLWVVMAQVQNLAEELPTYTENVKSKVRSLHAMGEGGVVKQLEQMAKEISGAWYNSLPRAPQKRGAAAAPTPAPPEEATKVVMPEQDSFLSALIAWVTPLVELLGMILLTIVLTIFMLIKRENLRDRVIALFGYGRMVTASKAVDDAGERIARYLFMQLIINTINGVCWGAGLYFIGVNYALLWGAMSVVMRYVPYVGTPIAALFPVLLGIAQFPDWGPLLLIVGYFVVLEFITANFVEPRLFGDSIGVSEVAMLVSAAFWTLLWGVTGLVLCGPLTVCLVVLGKHSPQLRFFALLLGNEPVLGTHLSFYQRLLARDQDEAWQLAQAEVRKTSVAQTIDEMLLPSITFAKRDFDHELLDQNEEELVFQSIRDIFVDISDRDAKAEAAAGNTKEVTAHDHIKIFACAARDQGDVLALDMLRQVLDGGQWEVQVIPLGTLTSELLTLLKAETVPIILIAALPPGGLAHTRYLCKRLRSRFPGVKILVGRWGLQNNVDANREQLVEAGANEVAATLSDTIGQLNSWLPVLIEEQKRPISA